MHQLNKLIQLLYYFQIMIEGFDMYYILKDAFRIKKFNLPRLVRYNQYIKYNQDRCIFCFTPFYRNELISELQCGHVFHSECLIEHFKRNNKCPVCRQ